jgi:hypothetical protein
MELNVRGTPKVRARVLFQFWDLYLCASVKALVSGPQFPQL